MTRPYFPAKDGFGATFTQDADEAEPQVTQRIRDWTECLRISMNDNRSWPHEPPAPASSLLSIGILFSWHM